jgi:hypothetical protein
MQRRIAHRSALRLALVLGAATFTFALSCGGAGSGLTGQYCRVAAECDEEFMIIPIIGEDIPVDGVGNSDDSEAVCNVEVNGYISALRANSEEVCEELALAYEAFMACAIEEDSCDPWTDNDCDNEREDIRDAWDDAGGRCSE